MIIVLKIDKGCSNVIEMGYEVKGSVGSPVSDQLILFAANSSEWSWPILPVGTVSR